MRARYRRQGTLLGVRCVRWIRVCSPWVSALVRMAFISTEAQDCLLKQTEHILTLVATSCFSWFYQVSQAHNLNRGQAEAIMEKVIANENFGPDLW